MIHLLIAWRNLWFKPVQSMLTVAVVATSLAMTITVMLLASSIQGGLIKAAEPFDLIVGAKGSPNQLVLNTVFLQDVPIGNIDYSLTRELAANPLVATAIPIGFGDNYRGYRIVGTEAAIFEHRIKAGQLPWIQLAQGHPFREQYEAVIGAKTAAETGLKLGDQFVSSHGVVAGGESHADKKFTVVGVMRPLNGPYDQAIFVSLASIWDVHSHAHEEEGTGKDNDLDNHNQTKQGAEDEHNNHSDQDNERQHIRGNDDEHHQEEELGTTVVLVKPKGYAEAMRLYQEFQKDKRAQLIFPAQVVVKLFAILGEGEKVLSMIGYAVFAMAMLLVSFSLYWSALSRSRERAVLRALGASRKDIFTIILAEGMLLVCSGILLGILAGHGLFTLIAGALQKKTAVAITGAFSTAEAYTIIAILLVSIIASVIPALHTAKSNIAADL
ncbi:MAG TPA: ABC transporter permease [Methylomusa anaerophila]|uniref:Putative hemin transport system permease protein HrtB n=1 Tax=Methylomusa anaerophila TaxID=1930071 RepID=A0A348AGS9_9FIRM|nr:FtsX-like permease family protein [Methylomusa anaerophila]BBB90277.1 FtsX-like permease family protein [Methylomusa anaerophila]HML89378.1 ABC transporter permease [Methylomusa anaerophila]